MSIAQIVSTLTTNADTIIFGYNLTSIWAIYGLYIGVFILSIICLIFAKIAGFSGLIVGLVVGEIIGVVFCTFPTWTIFLIALTIIYLLFFGHNKGGNPN